MRGEITRTVDGPLDVGQGHRRSTSNQQVGRSDATSRCPDDHDSLPRHRKRHLTPTHHLAPRAPAAPSAPPASDLYLSFSVVRLSSAKITPTITKRVMTFGSLQPMSSK